MRHVRLALVSILLGISWPGVVEACTCGPFIGPNAGNGLLVSGSVEADVEAGVESPWWDYSSRLIADKVWFGPDQRVFRLIAPYRFMTTCGGAFVGRPGERYIAWLYPFGGDYYSMGSGCGIVGWANKDRPAIEESLRRMLAVYDDIDRRLQATPRDADLWHARLKIATDLKDVHGRLRSLRRLVELAPAPDIDLLRDAATTSDVVHDSDAAARYADLGLKLSPGDEELKAIQRRATLRRGYDKDGMALTKELDGITWTNQRKAEARLDFIRLGNFQIRHSTLERQIIFMAQLTSGTIRETSLTQASVGNSQLAGVLMRDVQLKFASFSHTKIQLSRIADADFSNTVLTETTIESTGIANTSFRDARLTKVKFEGSSLDNADLDSARLIDVDFSGAALTGVDFTDAYLERVRFQNVRLRRVDVSNVKELHLKDAIIDCGTRLPAGFDLTKAAIIVDTPSCDGKPNNRNFAGDTYLNRWEWGGLDLTNAVFARTNWKYLYFTRSILRGADFSGAKVDSLQGYEVDFREARFTGATLGDALGGYVDFRLADLRGADFSGATLKIPYVQASPFRGAKYDSRTKWPATFLGGDGRAQPFDPAEHGAILVKD
jgi:uncharacterized protein YjbI with pentapeptide repeats